MCLSLGGPSTYNSVSSVGGGVHPDIIISTLLHGYNVNTEIVNTDEVFIHFISV